MSATKDRKHSVPPNKIPRCDQWVWIVKPTEESRGRGFSCRERATHTVTFVETGPVRTEHTCLAHLGELLDRAERRRAFQRFIAGTEWPAPITTTLTFTVDTRAAAYGRRRYLRAEHVITGPVTPALVTGEAPLLAAVSRPRRTHRAKRPAPTGMGAGPAQQMLF